MYKLALGDPYTQTRTLDIVSQVPDSPQECSENAVNVPVPPPLPQPFPFSCLVFQEAAEIPLRSPALRNGGGCAGRQEPGGGAPA